MFVTVRFADHTKNYSLREFKGAKSCGVRGPFLLVIDCDGTGHYFPADRVVTAHAAGGVPASEAGEAGACLPASEAGEAGACLPADIRPAP